ncbi:hypothetical protein OS493_027034 [Desmophyllum pertusum]|uniref:Uncharacterized protein n=1 Tax=Desmophyllum pertusum TaxID=174260 RepID=A0A9W9Y9W6_9CNID|nr:hypothetical protein OS493_027034 [Desmophyllum pertusum]
MMMLFLKTETATETSETEGDIDDNEDHSSNRMTPPSSHSKQRLTSKSYEKRGTSLLRGRQCEKSSQGTKQNQHHATERK